MLAYDYLFKWIKWLLAINPVLTVAIVTALSLANSVNADPDDPSLTHAIKNVIIAAFIIEGIFGIVTLFYYYFK